MRFVRYLHAILIVIVLFSVNSPAHADIRSEFDRIFDLCLRSALNGSGAASESFAPSNVESSESVIRSLQNFVVTSTSSFPLSSTAAGLTFDFSSGVPTALSTSSGPIFAENARTLGKGRLNIGMNYTSRNLSKVRGVSTDDIEFRFLHADIGSEGLGDDEREYDIIELEMNMDLDASIFAFYATYGLLDNLDVGIAIPIVRFTVKSDPIARVDSYTFATNGSANFYYTGTSSSPGLIWTPPPIDETTTGLADIALRGKYSTGKLDRFDTSILAELRLPTGEERDFVGSGKMRIKGLFIASTDLDPIHPHLNIGYEHRPGDQFVDQFIVKLGYDQKLSDAVTMAVEWNGQFEVGSEADDRIFPEDVRIGPSVSGDQFLYREVSASNVPNFDSDHITDVSFGFKWHPKPKWQIMGNLILPTNSGGLRSDYITTFGVEYSL